MHEIIWTRSVADWEKDKELFSDKSSVNHYPCIKQESLTNIPTATMVDHIIITSKFAVDCLQNHKAWWDVFCRPEVKVWCFGQRVSKKIETYRVSKHEAHCQNGQELAIHLSKKLPLDSKIIFFSAEKTAFDIIGFLREKYFQKAHQISLYKNKNPIHNKFLFHKDKFYKIAFASPSAAKNFF